MMVLLWQPPGERVVLGHWGEGVPPAGPSPVPALRVWWGLEHLWWRVGAWLHGRQL